MSNHPPITRPDPDDVNTDYDADCAYLIEKRGETAEVPNVKGYYVVRSVEPNDEWLTVNLGMSLHIRVPAYPDPASVATDVWAAIEGLAREAGRNR